MKSGGIQAVEGRRHRFITAGKAAGLLGHWWADDQKLVCRVFAKKAQQLDVAG
jgi:predicted glycosyl hydrolase (DUF1957 family)